MSIDQLKAKCKCCSCEQPLANSESLNMVQVDKPAKWQFPVWGNIITGAEKMAVAYICDPCFDNGQAEGKRPVIRFVVETNDTEIKYHPIESL